MDPFLEDVRYFPDLHGRFHVHLSELLQSLLPAPYFAVVNERLLVEVENEYHRHIEPDTDVLISSLSGSEADAGGSLAVSFQTRTEPIIVTVAESEPASEKFVEIRTRDASGDERVVTTVELLSISNKTAGSFGREAYLKKQSEVIRSGIHLIEIDLLRSGRHSTAAPLTQLASKAPGASYHVCVTVNRRPLQHLLYPFQLEETMPEIAVPLLSRDGLVALDLQTVFDRCYDAGPYRRRLRYQVDQLNPPLDARQREWAEALLAAKTPA
jgi:hypothetical protein